MRDVDERRRKAGVQLGNFRSHLRAELCVEVGQRLVEKEDLGLADDGTAERDTLALTTRKSLGLTRKVIGDAEDLCRGLDLFVDDFLGHLAELETECHVVVDGHMRIERVVLEDHRDVSVLRDDVVDELAVDIKFARRNFFETGDHTERRGLTAARGTDEDDEFLIPDVEAEVEHCLVAAGIDLVDAFE